MQRSFLPGPLLFLALTLLQSPGMRSQQIQPVIAEYTRTADGFFQVKNEGTASQIVTVEPKSFSLDEDGNGIFRPLDPSIHVDLSSSSVRLEPQGTARIFYRVNADALPAWLCIYATFSPLKETAGVNLRIMLPHTIYLYGKDDLRKADILVTGIHYDPSTHRVTASLQNQGHAAGRVTQVEVVAGRASQAGGGFPLLPGAKRRVSIDWPNERRPEDLQVRFSKFDLKLPIFEGEE